MKLRWMHISEEFGLYKVTGSNGQTGTGISVGAALKHFALHSGTNEFLLQGIFEKAIPKQDRQDEPVSG